MFRRCGGEFFQPSINPLASLSGFKASGLELVGDVLRDHAVIVALLGCALRRAFAFRIMAVLVGAGHVVGELGGCFIERLIDFDFLSALLLTELVCLFDDHLLDLSRLGDLTGSNGPSSEASKCST